MPAWTECSYRTFPIFDSTIERNSEGETNLIDKRNFRKEVTEVATTKSKPCLQRKSIQQPSYVALDSSLAIKNYRINGNWKNWEKKTFSRFKPKKASSQSKTKKNKSEETWLDQINGSWKEKTWYLTKFTLKGNYFTSSDPHPDIILLHVCPKFWHFLC